VRVGLLWRAEWDPFDAGTLAVDGCKLHGMFAAFSDLGVDAEPVVYSDETVDSVRAQLLGLDGVLVWVNPIEKELDRSKLDALLREVAADGVWVSAHPDVILRIATKEVLVDTREMSWGTDTRLYRSLLELAEALPGRLAGGPVVLKQHRGMGGGGVWKVERASGTTDLVVQHAAGGAPPETVSLSEFLVRCEPYFEDAGLMIEQPFQPRLPEGLIRAYLSQDRVVGFTHQFPRGLMPPDADTRSSEKRWEPAEEPRYADLRVCVEKEWVPELQRIAAVDTHALPVIWDIDFLYGPKTAEGEDTFVLCEINASSTFAFPDFAMPTVARAAMACIEQHRAFG
jgi:Domain of unknown function (DUF6815)